MDICSYWKKHGTKATEQLAKDCGSTFNYFEHLINYRKRPSTKLAHLMIEKSGGELTLAELLLSNNELVARRTKKREARAAKKMAKAGRPFETTCPNCSHTFQATARA